MRKVQAQAGINEVFIPSMFVLDRFIRLNSHIGRVVSPASANEIDTLKNGFNLISSFRSLKVESRFDEDLARGCPQHPPYRRSTLNQED